MGRCHAPARCERLRIFCAVRNGGTHQTKRLFYLLAETDDIYPEWERLVSANRVLGKEAYDARLVATMNVHRIKLILTFNIADFKRYEGIQMLHPDDVLSSKP